MLITPKVEAAEPPTKVEVVNITDLVRQDAEKYHLNYKKFYATLDCESRGFVDVAIQSGYVKNGVREKSFGLAQINLPSHLDITYASATDPVFAVDWAAKEFAKGKAEHEFSCYDIEKTKNWL